MVKNSSHLWKFCSIMQLSTKSSLVRANQELQIERFCSELMLKTCNLKNFFGADFLHAFSLEMIWSFKLPSILTSLNTYWSILTQQIQATLLADGPPLNFVSFSNTLYRLCQTLFFIWKMTSNLKKVYFV
jgi:hypothetical protein